MEGWLFDLAERRGKVFLSKNDVLLLLIVFVVTSTLYIWSVWVKNANTSYSKGIVVRVGGEEIFKIEEAGEWQIKNRDGKYLTTLHFDGEKVWVTESDCPDKICEKTGRAGPGGSIICVPNRMIIEFKKITDSDQGVDIETW